MHVVRTYMYNQLYTLLAPAAEIATHAPARERVDAVRARAAVQTWRANALVSV